MSLQNLVRIARSHRGWYLDYKVSGRKAWPLSSSHLIVSRHWNSDTPVIPRQASGALTSSDINGAIGGGYFLNFEGIGVAIDPGHAFLKTLYQRYDTAARDIDFIIVTHFHQDHCGDIANYFNLSRRPGYRPVIFAPIPVLQYLALLDNADLTPVFPGMAITVTRGDQHILSIEFLPTLHWQTITPASLYQSPYSNFVDFHMSAVGLSIQLGNAQQDLCFRNIVITGDTMFPCFDDRDFLPQCYDLYLGAGWEHIHLNHVNRITRRTFEAMLRAYFANFITAYRDRGADIVCYHIGSIEKQFAQLGTATNLQFQYPGHHLGVLGIIRLMKLMQRQPQKLGIITEWGEELRGERKNISRFITDCWRRLSRRDEPSTRPVPFLPSDIDLMIDLRNGLIKCSDHPCFHDYVDMGAEEQGAEYIRYKSKLKWPDVGRYERTCNWE